MPKSKKDLMAGQPLPHTLEAYGLPRPTEPTGELKTREDQTPRSNTGHPPHLRRMWGASYPGVSED